MGVGKTTVCQYLKYQLPRSVFLDGDWCWDADPFLVTAETRQMVLDNICHLLNNFLHCSAYENILFGWVMHEQKIIDHILSHLDLQDCTVHPISLICDADTLHSRLQKDIDAGLRSADILEISTARLPLYHHLRTIQIDTSNRTVEEIAEEICRIGKAALSD